MIVLCLRNLNLRSSLSQLSTEELGIAGAQLVEDVEMRPSIMFKEEDKRSRRGKTGDTKFRIPIVALSGIQASKTRFFRKRFFNS